MNYPKIKNLNITQIAGNLVSVQPMTAPAGLIFHLDFQYHTGPDIDPFFSYKLLTLLIKHIETEFHYPYFDEFLDMAYHQLDKSIRDIHNHLDYLTTKHLISLHDGAGRKFIRPVDYF
jgi:hypothetical protein